MDLTEKNKGAYKLQNFGPIYCINLDGQPERWHYMEDQFRYWELTDYERISAYDGREDDLSDIIKGKYPDTMSSGEIGCVTSHLNAIKHFLDTSDAPYAIMMEDDCDLSLARNWSFTWTDFIARVPYAWDVIQLAIICTGDVVVPIHTRFVNEFSTACYVITRHHAEKLVKFHCRGGYTGKQKYKLDQGVKPRAVADDLIYNSGITYACPLLLYKIELGSTIHPEHIGIFHQGNHDGIRNFWAQQGAQMSVESVTDFDPYRGRVAESTAPQPA